MRLTWTAVLALVLALLAAGCSSDDKKPDDSKSTMGDTKPEKTDVDMREYLQSTLLVSPWPKESAGLKRGQWLEIKNASAGKTSTMRIAIVGEEGPNFLVEESATVTGGGEGAFLGFIEGLTIEKATGKVVAAVAAKKGEKGKSIKLGPEPVVQATTPTTADESVTVAAGTFAATKTVIAGQLSETATWVGKDGDAKGVVLKEASDDAVLRELKVLANEDATIGGKPLKVTHATYSDGSETWFVRGVAVPFYGTGDTTWVKQSRAGTTTELAWGEDAKPEIDWAK